MDKNRFVGMMVNGIEPRKEGSMSTQVRLSNGKRVVVNLSQEEIERIGASLAQILLAEVREIRQAGRRVGDQELQVLAETACRKVMGAVFQDSLNHASKVIQEWPDSRRGLLGGLS